MQTASVSASEFTPPLTRRTVELATRRYTINLTQRQETAVIAECDRRGIGISDFMRRIIDGWIENRIAKKTQGSGE